jgi:hypothetical protein
MQSWFNTTCSDDECYSVWQQQLNAMSTFTALVNNSVAVGAVATSQVGQLANAAASEICGSSATGDENWMEALFNAKAQALPLLVEIQQGAKVASVANCQLTLN